MSELPKIIHGYWHQGRDVAPDAVKRCWDLWRRMNPGWELIIYEWADVAPRFGERGIDGDNMSLQMISDFVRIDCLATTGGIWVDTYTVPLRPLDEWLLPLMSAGFFAFHDPYRKRLSESWFLASLPDHPLATAWRDAMAEYWQMRRRPMRSPHELDRRFRGKFARFRGRFLDLLQGPLSARDRKRIYPVRKPVWAVSPEGGGRFAIYPYFAFAMLFDRMIEQDASLRGHFARYPKFTSYDSQLLRNWSKRYHLLTEQDVRAMCLDKTMQKLNLKTRLPDHLMEVLVGMAETNIAARNA